MTIQRFTAASFSNPPAAFRPLQIVHGFDGMLTNPAKLEGEEGIAARLDKLRSLGIGGVVANVGFKDYLQSPRQWEVYRAGLKAAAERDMVLWWYDEKGYPSVPRAKVVAAVRKAAVGDFVLGSPDPDILYTHRHVDGRHVYFVVNDAPEPRCIRPQLGVPGEFALYRPLSGAVEPPGPVGEIRLDGLEGVFLVGGRSVS